MAELICTFLHKIVIGKFDCHSWAMVPQRRNGGQVKTTFKILTNPMK